MSKKVIFVGLICLFLGFGLSLSQPTQRAEHLTCPRGGTALEAAQNAEHLVAEIDWDEIISELDAGFERETPLVNDGSDVIWYFRAGNWIMCTPLLDADGSVYFGSGDGNFYALDTSGNETWRYNVGAPIVADPTFDNQGRIVFGALDGALYCLDKDGELVFSYWTEGPIFSTASFDLAGNIYFGSNDFYLYKLNPSGEVLGRFETGGWIDSKPTFLSDGRLCFSSYDGVIYVVDQDLNELARYETDTWLTRAFAVGPDDTIYAGGMNGLLFAVDPSGTLKWQFDSGQAIFSSPVVTDTRVFFGSNAGGFFSVDVSSGTENWRFGISAIEIISSPPTLGADGYLYFGVSDHKVYGLGKDSLRRWSFDTGVEIGGTPLTGKPILGGIAVSDAGTAYFGNCGGVLFAAKTGRRLLSPVVGSATKAHPLCASPARLERLRDSPVGFDGVRMAPGRRLPTSEPNAVDMALKTMCMDRKCLDRPTESFDGLSFIKASTLDITDDILDDAFVGPPYAKDITDAILFEDDEMQEYLLTAAQPLGIDVAPVTVGYLLSDTPLQTAISDICEEHDRTLTPSELGELASMAGRLSLELRQGMALILYAMNDSWFLFETAFRNVSPGVKGTLRQVLPSTYVMWLSSSYLDDTFRSWKYDLDQESFALAATTTLAAVNRAGEYLAAANDSDTDEILFGFDTPLGYVMVGGASDNTYDAGVNGVRETNALLIDIGGNDQYLGRVCGATDNDTTVSVCIDLAGDDVYHSDSHGCQGWGLLGLGALIDLQGNDLYVGQKHSQAAGVFGVGVLQDVYGDDIFAAKEFSQGAAALGIAVLSNDFGNDIYFSPEYSQGFGFTFGSGVLRDREGDDFYFVGGFDVDFRENKEGEERYVCMGQGFGYGTRRDGDYYSGGGIGILTDGAGNDYYLGDYFAQGSSYWFATGILDDKAGDDVYVARRYSTGAGIHNSVGVLVDEAGNDEYWGWGVGIGHGLDKSVGIVVDVMGDDCYSARGWYMMGHGGDGVGVQLDNAGNDVYSQRDASCLGYGGPYMGNHYRPLGIFVDADGTDAYTTKGNDRFWVSDETGVGIDMTAGDTGCLMPE